ncbi:hypothetical protein PINS_up021129 [Pythium insidiosum]|nr:hypothetical protein PINS_up021129 [Pythium insidiosum]
MTPMQWEIFGMTLLTAWIVWFLLLTWRTSTNVTTCSANQHKLNGLFQRLKYSFVIGQGIIFVRACLHPNMGFVHAQLELTIINLLLPSIYVISLVMLWMMSMASVKSLLFAVPTSFGLAALIFTGSKMTQKPHSFVVVFLFLFDISFDRGRQRRQRIESPDWCKRCFARQLVQRTRPLAVIGT